MSILDKIADTKRSEVSSAKYRTSLVDLKQQAKDAPPCRDFIAPFRDQVGEGGTLRVIAEIKKTSPSAGVIRADFDPVAIARAYRDGGAAALSVLTDKVYFQGDIAYLKLVRDAVPLPVLRKDFTIDPYQIYESRVYGTDAILLIAAMLEAAQIEDYLGIADELGLGVLVELHDAHDLAKVHGLPGRYLLGVNNRDLKTFKVSLEASKTLAPLMPRNPDTPWISESGLKTREDLLALAVIGYSGFLIGETLMREPDVEAALQRLVAE